MKGEPGPSVVLGDHVLGAAGPEYEWVVPMSGVASRMSPQHVALLHLAVVLSGVAMARSGKGYYAMAASSSAGGDPDPGWDAASSLQQVAQSRAWQWRTAECLDRGDDPRQRQIEQFRSHTAWAPGA